MIIDTPWGPSQTVDKISDDITLISTAGHGGYRVAGEAWRQFRQKFPTVKLWAGSGENVGWFEEDCDWALVVIAFPDLFKEHEGLLKAAIISALEFLTLTDQEAGHVARLIREHNIRLR